MLTFEQTMVDPTACNSGNNYTSIDYYIFCIRILLILQYFANTLLLYKDSKNKNIHHLQEDYTEEHF